MRAWVDRGSAECLLSLGDRRKCGLIGKEVQIRLYAEHLEVYYKGRLVERMERMRGEREARVDYRHIIGSLVRKPGAFARYRFRSRCSPP